MKSKLITLIFIQVLFLSREASALALFAKQYADQDKKTSFIEVYLNTEGKRITTIEGELLLDPFAQSVDAIKIEESPFTLWPNRPSLLDNKISFTGGQPGGIIGDSVLLFRIYLKDLVKEELRIIPRNTVAYTIETPEITERVSDRTIFLDQDRVFSAYTKLQDTIPPNSFTVDLGRSEGVFEGRYFLSFITSDKDSGIAYYEVQEGDSNPVLADSPYVLRDQTLQTKVTVKAYDNAGNSTVAEFKPLYKLPIKIKISIILICILLAIATLRILWIKRGEIIDTLKGKSRKQIVKIKKH
jgi:hypothetical protein